MCVYVLFMRPYPRPDAWKGWIKAALLALGAGCIALNASAAALDLGAGGPGLASSVTAGGYALFAGCCAVSLLLVVGFCGSLIHDARAEQVEKDRALARKKRAIWTAEPSEGAQAVDRQRSRQRGQLRTAAVVARISTAFAMTTSPPQRRGRHVSVKEIIGLRGRGGESVPALSNVESSAAGLALGVNSLPTYVDRSAASASPTSNAQRPSGRLPSMRRAADPRGASRSDARLHHAAAALQPGLTSYRSVFSAQAQTRIHTRNIGGGSTGFGSSSQRRP
jgi:hypothetical protein